MQVEIQSLASHPHLNRIIGTHDKPCGLEIWFLRVRLDGAEVTRLLYGRMLPVDFVQHRWNGRAEDDFRPVDGELRAEVARVNLFTTAEKATAFLIAFYSGRPFADASADAGISLSPAVAGRYSKFCVTGTQRLRPPMHLPSRDYYRFESARLSVSAHTSATSASLSSLDKSSLFRVGDSSSPKLAAFCSEQLKSETGLEFEDLDAWRWGDFELVVLPAKDDQERDLVILGGTRQDIVVDIQGHLLNAPANRYMVRFDFMNDECLAHTVVQEVAASALPCTLSAKVPPAVSEMVDAYRLAIDVECIADMVWYPCVRWGVYLVREVNSQIQMDGGARIKWDWLSDTVRSAHQRRLEGVEGLARGKLASSSVMGSRKGDAWVPANRQARAFTRTLVPRKSAGKFLLTYAEGEGDGRLELVEWMRSLFREHTDKQIAWFDPYMEDVGVNLLGSQTPDAGNYIIFTNYPPPERAPDCVDNVASLLRTVQHTLQGTQRVEKTKANRIANLLAAARRWESTGIGSRFRIACLPPETFHDRMILVTNGRNEPVVGYHLSNSIQLANQNYPLLITPIPSDVLQKVVPYMEALLAPRPDKDGVVTAPATIVYDSNNRQPVERRRKDIFEYAESAAVLAWWLQDPALAKLSAEQLKAELQQRGFLEDTSLRSPEFEQLPRHLLDSGFPFANFNPAWEALGIILASSMAGDWIDAGAFKAPPGNTLTSLESYLSDRPEAESVYRSRTYVPQLDDELRQPMSELLTSSSRALSALTSYHVDVAWGDYYAIKLLWQASPDRLLAWLANTASEKWADDARRLFCLRCAISVISHSIDWGCSGQQLNALFSARLDFLRWMGFVAVEANLIGGQNSLQSIHALPGVTGVAKAQLLGWLLARTERQLDAVTRSALVADYLAALPPQLSKRDLQDALDVQRGHHDRLFGGGLQVFALVIVPLVEAGRLTAGLAAEAWIEELSRCWKQKQLSSLFRKDAEWPFTEEAGFLLAHCDAATQKKLLAKIASDVSSWKRPVQRPLGAEANWSEVDRSYTLLMWASILLMDAYIKLPRPHNRENDFRKLLEDVRATVARRLATDWRRSGRSHLYDVYLALAAHVD